MVVDFEKDPQTDRVFHALSHSVRRHILRRTMRVDISISGLARRYPMSFAAVQKHVAVLESAGLVSKRAHGREQIVSGNPDNIETARGLLEELEEFWRIRLDSFDEVLGKAGRGENDGSGQY
jgi:DNA-binding transcriptional ArsR family regulator